MHYKTASRNFAGTLLVVFAVASSLSACATGVDLFLNNPIPSGNGLHLELAREYQAGASVETSRDNWDAGGTMALIGATAKKGEVPFPLDPAQQAVLPKDLPLLDAARRVVAAAVIAPDSRERLQVCAAAQRYYDNWVLAASANRYGVGGSYLGGAGGPVEPALVARLKQAFADALESCSPRYYAIYESGGGADIALAPRPAPVRVATRASTRRTASSSRSTRVASSARATPAAPAKGRKITERVVYFAFDSAALDDLDRDVLREVSGMRNDYRDFEVRVEGHTDTSGPRSYNQRLGIRRANSVANVLKRMNIGNVSVSSRGEDSPAVQTGDGVKEPLNRRAEISIYGNE